MAPRRYHLRCWLPSAALPMLLERPFALFQQMHDLRLAGQRCNAAVYYSGQVRLQHCISHHFSSAAHYPLLLLLLHTPWLCARSPRHPLLASPSLVSHLVKLRNCKEKSVQCEWVNVLVRERLWLHS